MIVGKNIPPGFWSRFKSCSAAVAVGAWGGQSHWYREEDQGRCWGGSEDGDPLCGVSLQRRRKVWQNQRVQGNLAGPEKTKFWFHHSVRLCEAVDDFCRVWRPWRRRSMWVMLVLTELRLSWGKEAISPPKELTAAPECLRPTSEWPLAQKSVFLSSTKIYLLFVDAVSLSIADNISTDVCPAGRRWESSSTRIQNGTSSGRTSRTITSYSTVSRSCGFISFDPVDFMLYNRSPMTCSCLSATGGSIELIQNLTVKLSKV